LQYTNGTETASKRSVRYMHEKTKSKPTTKFFVIRQQLPKHYSVAVAKKAVVTPRQVLLVFRGEIKNPEMINKVYEAARLVVSETRLASKRSGVELSKKVSTITCQ